MLTHLIDRNLIDTRVRIDSRHMVGLGLHTIGRYARRNSDTVTAHHPHATKRHPADTDI